MSYAIILYNIMLSTIKYQDQDHETMKLKPAQFYQKQTHGNAAEGPSTVVST